METQRGTLVILEAEHNLIYGMLATPMRAIRVDTGLEL